jgi:SAM-dependent methyltransferase
MQFAGGNRTYYESRPRGGEISIRELERISSVIDSVPSDVGTILELGCGDGRIASLLASNVDIVGTDISLKALQSCAGLSKRVQADVTQHLPFLDRAFDLVLCCEVLEHLPDAIFAVALREIERLSKSYVLLSVPYRENLRENSVRCPECGGLFHVYGHLRSFDDAKFERLLPGFTPRKIWKCGPISQWLPPLRWLRRTPVGGGVCLHCSARSPRSPLTLDQKVLDWSHVNLIEPWHKKPYWIAGVFHREPVSP